mgnify:FL=1|tara:strand:- start:171 stop:698 length:528 start_codon:yes stop_codon:yes gene_type:complete
MVTSTMHYYPSKELIGDYIRGAIGVVICATPIVLTGSMPVAGWILGVLVLLFAGFIIRTALRHYTRVAMDDLGLTSSGIIRKQIAWTDVSKVKMRYYSTKRDRTEGWMQLKITGQRGRTIEMDSILTDFQSIISKLGTAAVQAGAIMDETTRANFALMGIDLLELANAEPEDTVE